MATIRKSRADDADRIIEVWKSAVDATHDFLSSEDRAAIENEVRQLLPSAPLWLAADANDEALGFMLLDGTHMEALFIDAAMRGTGVGRSLVAHALSFHQSISTDVNAQNDQALGFYLKMGFTVVGRSELDGQGRPYPLLHLQYKSQSKDS